MSCKKELNDITFSGERLEEVERRQKNAFVWKYLMNLPETFSEPSDSGISSASALSQYSGEEGRGNYFSFSFKWIVVPCYEPNGMLFCKWKLFEQLRKLVRGKCFIHIVYLYDKEASVHVMIGSCP